MAQSRALSSPEPSALDSPLATPRPSRLLGISLSASALKARNVDKPAFLKYWECEEEKRVERLVKASKELGFELPRQCY
jgi:hypothetical protein